MTIASAQVAKRAANEFLLRNRIGTIGLSRIHGRAPGRERSNSDEETSSVG